MGCTARRVASHPGAALRESPAERRRLVGFAIVVPTPVVNDTVPGTSISAFDVTPV